MMKVLQGVLKPPYYPYLSGSKMHQQLRTLEHRKYIGGAPENDSATRTQQIELSGWSHLKLVFKQHKFIKAKLYGGTVRNNFLVP